MLYDEETGLWYTSPRALAGMKLRSKLHTGELRPIVGYSRYTIMPDGVVMNLGRATPVSVYTSGPRPAISLVDDNGRQRTLSLARLVASHFIPIPDDGQYYDVVFDDGNVHNVHPNNLRWEPRWKRHANPDNYDIDIR